MLPAESNENSSPTEHEDTKVLLFILFFILAILTCPILICDFYFAASNSECITMQPDGLAVNMKSYLFVCATVTLTILLVTSVVITNYTEEMQRHFNKYCMLYYLLIIISQIFSLAWNIVGAVVFWGTIYPEHICTKLESTYLFASLIIKLLGALSIRINNKSRD